MKVLSIVVPCFNSQAYMRQCIDTLLPGGVDVEIIIVNDGSTDETGNIADEYRKAYPNIIKVVHQENGGHGEAINTGIRHAKGYYFKVVDSDDWVDSEAYEKILATLKRCMNYEDSIDMLVSNYVYEKEGARHKKVIRYARVFPEECIFKWEEAGTFKKGQYILMHSVMFRTHLLTQAEISLPKHTFYVDNLFVYCMLPYVKKMYYVNADFYRYYIGREDQSVNEEIMIQRIDQQLKVNKLMISKVDVGAIEDKKQQKYLYHYLEIITTISSVLLNKAGTKEHLKKKRELWQYMKEANIRTYYKLRYRIFGSVLNLPGLLSRKISACAYKISKKMIGFN